MGGTKKSKHCGYVRPHAGHVWRDQNSKMDRKHWCAGTVEESRHVHVWDAANGPIMREREIDAPGLLEVASEPWNGPFECPCGQAVWLKNGRKVRTIKTEVRFPKADVMERTLALKAKLDRGEEFSEADKEEFQAIADALIEAFKPLVAAFQKMAEQVTEYLQSFLDKLDPDIARELHRLAQTYGEPVDTPVETIELRDAVTGEVIAEHVLGYDPIAATQHAATDIVEDAAQPLLAPEPSDPVEIAKRALREPFTAPFKVNMTHSDLERSADRAALDALLGDTLRRYRS